METTENVNTSTAAPAAPAQDTQPSAAPSAAPAATSAGADVQAPEPTQIQGTAGLARAAESQRDAAQAQAQGSTQAMLAGKFKTPQDLEHGYQELQKFSSRQGQELREIRERLQAIESATAGRQQPAEQPKDPVLENWAKDPIFGPLSDMPDPRYQPEEHEEWIQKVFAPRFRSDPAGTFNYFMTPRLYAAQKEVVEYILRELESRDMAQKVNGYFGSKPDFLSGQSVDDAMKAWGPEGYEEYRKLLEGGVPLETAVELMALRRGKKPLEAAAAAAEAKEADLRKLASAAPNRGAAATSPDGLVGEGDTLQEMVANSMAALGSPLPGTAGRQFPRISRTERAQKGK